MSIVSFEKPTFDGWPVKEWMGGRRGSKGIAAIVLSPLIAAFALTILSCSVRAQDRDDPAGRVQTISRMTIIQNKSKSLSLRYPYADATVGAPDIADIVPLSDRQLYVVGKKVGRTNVLLFDNEKRLIGTVDVDVRLDAGGLGSDVRAASGGGGIQVQDVQGNIVLKGDGRDAPTIHRAMSVAGGLGGSPVVNALRLRSPQQVMLKVRFVEANRLAVRSVGVRWQAILNNRLAGVIGSGSSTSRLAGAGLFAGSSTRPGGPIVPNGAAGPAVFDVLTNSLTRASPVATILTQLVNTGAGSLDVVISALEEQGVLRSLAEPNLVALSGESAEFIAGGQIPVPIAQTAGAGLGGGIVTPAITIQWKDFGVKLNFTPTVLADSVISLKLEPEVSDLDYSNAVTLQGYVVPAITIRRARTTVELRDGQSFAIAGLIQSKSFRDIEQVPWLGSVPVLGALFRSTEFQKQETELVALVTPYLVKPVPPGNKDPRLKTPLETAMPGNDFDLFLNGTPELAKNTPVYVTPTGMEQPVQGAIAPGAPGPQPPALAPADSIQQFFGMFGSTPSAPPAQ